MWSREGYKVTWLQEKSKPVTARLKHYGARHLIAIG